MSSCSAWYANASVLAAWAGLAAITGTLGTTLVVGGAAYAAWWWIKHPMKERVDDLLDQKGSRLAEELEFLEQAQKDQSFCRNHSVALMGLHAVGPVNLRRAIEKRRTALKEIPELKEERAEENDLTAKCAAAAIVLSPGVAAVAAVSTLAVRSLEKKSQLKVA